MEQEFIWHPKGRIFYIDNLTDQMVTHALGATVLVLSDCLRIYFSSRTPDNKSLPYYIDVAIDNPSKIIHIEKMPLLSLGELGTFDDDGIMPCSVVQLDRNTVYLYYVGWNRGVTVSYRNSIGLAVSHDGGKNFTRMFRGPVIDRNKNEPHMAASPCVLKEGDLWHCWYTSGTKWLMVDNKTEPVYTIRYAYSHDGIDWVRDGKACIKQEDESQAFARPTVIKKDGLYRMWYNYRSSKDYRDGDGSYCLGYAESENAHDWVRKDKQIKIERSDWDSKMQCYPQIIRVNNKLLLFYNGNGFGREGIGYAVCDI
jgi:sucrose-6-phosphate hydrolase SacC (GH32 family)